MKRNFFILLFSLILAGSFWPGMNGFGNFAFAESEKSQIHFFYSAVCPHCAKEKEFLTELAGKYPEVEIKEYEVFYDSENKKILSDFYENYKVPVKDRGWVPATFTPGDYFIGFNEQTAAGIENCVRECSKREKKPSDYRLKIPIFGEVDASTMPLPVLTAVLGTLDGFNPCAMWILVVLISLLLASGSRKKMLLVGGTFIFAEALLYFLIMAAWLNVFIAIGYISLIRILIGIFGIAFGVWRLRDFILWKPGVCKAAGNSKFQEKLMVRLNKILESSFTPAAILGIFGLALGVNLIEFLCSAGFPAIYTRVLALQNLPFIQYHLYLIFYIFFYMLDDLLVFAVALFALKQFGFSDKYSRYSTLVAGLLILVLGILLIFKPEFLMFA